MRRFASRVPQEVQTKTWIQAPSVLRVSLASIPMGQAIMEIVLSALRVSLLHGMEVRRHQTVLTVRQATTHDRGRRRAVCALQVKQTMTKTQVRRAERAQLVHILAVGRLDAMCVPTVSLTTITIRRHLAQHAHRVISG